MLKGEKKKQQQKKTTENTSSLSLPQNVEHF